MSTKQKLRTIKEVEERNEKRIRAAIARADIPRMMQKADDIKLIAAAAVVICHPFDAVSLKKIKEKITVFDKIGENPPRDIKAELMEIITNGSSKMGDGEEIEALSFILRYACDYCSMRKRYERLESVINGGDAK